MSMLKRAPRKPLKRKAPFKHKQKMMVTGQTYRLSQSMWANHLRYNKKGHMVTVQHFLLVRGVSPDACHCPLVCNTMAFKVRLKLIGSRAQPLEPFFTHLLSRKCGHTAESTLQLQLFRILLQPCVSHVTTKSRSQFLLSLPQRISTGHIILLKAPNRK